MIIVSKTFPIVNNITGLTRQESFQLELLCLLRLQSFYKCKCGTQHNHFPEVIRADHQTFTIYMTYCGKSLKDNLAVADIQINKSDVTKQIDCIIKNLKRCRVKHVDSPNSGQNLSINGDTLCLIDFDIAMISGEKPNRVAKKWGNYYGKDDDFYQVYRGRLNDIINMRYKNVTGKEIN